MKNVHSFEEWKLLAAYFDNLEGKPVCK